MRPTSERSIVQGPAGRIEVLIERPAGPVRGLALIGHPHPLHGGNLDNKVTATLARAFLAMGSIAVRPNFRGVGASDGVHDDGHGETQDFLFLVDAVPRLPQCAPLLPRTPAVALAGFSFGSYVAASAAQELLQRGQPANALVLIGVPAGKWPMPVVDPAALVIHGEVDETIALGEAFAWARASEVPVIVIPGADHFFHRRLTILKKLVLQNLLGAAQLAANASGTLSAEALADG